VITISDSEELQELLGGGAPSDSEWNYYRNKIVSSRAKFDINFNQDDDDDDLLPKQSKKKHDTKGTPSHTPNSPITAHPAHPRWILAIPQNH